MKLINNGLIAAALIVSAPSFTAAAQTHRKVAGPTVQTAKVQINEQGYLPGSLRLRRGIPAKVTFLRTTDNTCGTEIVIPAFGINRPLPLNQRVTVSFTPKRSGEFAFSCGMNMMHGKLIII